MEYFHYLLGLHHLSKSVDEWVYCLDVDQKTLVGVVDLDKLHATLLCQAFTVDSEDGGLAFGRS